MRPFLLLILMMIAAPPVHAQFIYHDEETGEIEILEQEKTEDEGKEIPESITAYADHVYQACMSKPHNSLRGESLELFCGCKSAKIPEEMTMEDIHAIFEGGEDARYQRERMLLFVDAVCLAYPLQEMMRDQCIESNGRNLRHPSRTCGCVFERIGAFVKLHAPSVLHYKVRETGKIVDNPMDVLIKSNKMKDIYKQTVIKCVSEHEY